MDIEKLAAEIAADPLARGYVTMEDSQVADSLNKTDRSGRKVVQASDARRFILLNGLWPRIQAVAANPENPVNQGNAITILQTLAPNSFDEIRMNDPEVYGAVSNMLSVMVAAGAMSPQNREAMLALGNAQISRADELGLGTVHHLDVAAARTLLNPQPPQPE